MWITAAVLSAFFGGVSTVLVKCGVKRTDSDVATALRTVVVFAFSWLVVFLVGSQNGIAAIPQTTFLYLMLSGMATGAAWICLLKALSCGSVKRVVPVDKAATVLSVLSAIVFFGETAHLAVKLICTAVLVLGIVLMAEKEESGEKTEGRAWLPYAIFSAVFGALSSLLAKPGFAGVESNLGNALRAVIILAMTWIAVLAKGKQSKVKGISRSELLFIGLSGLATGGAWLCYYYAIQNGVVSAVVPIDRLSILVSIVFARIVFKEKLSKKATVGLILMVIATVIMAITS